MSFISNLLFGDHNLEGDVGEWVASIRLSQNHIFSVYLLGGKTPTFDLLVEIRDEKNPYQFLVQVKASEVKDMYKIAGHIKTPVPNKKYQKLIKKPLPSYVAGLDILDEVMYIHPAYDTTVKVSSIPITYKLSKEDRITSKKNLELLRDDVIAYWKGLNIDTYKPNYHSIL